VRAPTSWARGLRILGGSNRVNTVICLASLALAISVVPAEAIDLACNGVMHTYQPKHIEAAVPPGAAIVDLEKMRFESPVGAFRITNVSDDSVSFDDPADGWWCSVPSTEFRV
jgi:hypothetical protein